ncbi:GMP-PDE, delta subunit-domain-containing protein [Cladochytrium replicatum]|nr:GMP-PDE, delta subunit-domain-containing protein [Cladochytrium replicatum]
MSSPVRPSSASKPGGPVRRAPGPSDISSNSKTPVPKSGLGSKAASPVRPKSGASTPTPPLPPKSAPVMKNDSERSSVPKNSTRQGTGGSGNSNPSVRPSKEKASSSSGAATPNKRNGNQNQSVSNARDSSTQAGNQGGRGSRPTSSKGSTSTASTAPKLSTNKQSEASTKRAESHAVIPEKIQASITPVLFENVEKLVGPTETFLCPLSANHYLQFLEFKIRDLEHNKVIFEVKRPGEFIWENPSLEVGDETRSIHYNFTADFLSLKEIGTTLTFAVGPMEIKKLRMVERHYFRDRLLKSFDFTFGFCIPNSINTWETVYAVPTLDQETVANMVANPGETQSDSFYFVDDVLVMHSKATYTYC